VPAGRLTLRILRASPRQPVALQLLGGETLRRGPWRFQLHPGPDFTVRETMLPPGVYRVRDDCCGAVTEQFRIVGGGDPVRLTLDVSGRWPAGEPRLRGRVVGFAGIDLGKARIAVDGAPASIPVDGSGRFAIPWAGRDLLSVTAVHPAALPSAEITGRRGRPGVVVLRLRPRNRAILRLAPTAEAPGTARVRVTPDGGEPRMLEGAIDGQGNLRFGGFAPGLSEIWIDLAGFAPLKLPRIRLGPGANDLGRAAPTRGSAIHIFVVGRSGEAPPELRLTARSRAKPRYERTAPAGASVIRGLGSGEFEVFAIERYSGRRLWSQKVHVDGSNAITLTLDLA